MPYKPAPIDTSTVQLTRGIRELTELLAANTHEVWAKGRMAEGWRYGRRRSDVRKLHPCLVPYEQLPDSEKQYDRNTAMETLRTITALGYRITKVTKAGKRKPRGRRKGFGKRRG